MSRMTLRVDLPDRVALEAPAAKIVAEGLGGSFALLPRHLDIAAALVPGILAYETPEGAERFLGTDRGCLVKTGRRVAVAVGGAVEGGTLPELRRRVREAFLVLDEHEEAAQTALARLEAGAIRRILRLEG
jgi:F-type H+-transporting ATPase subunit epsilon